jgi:hypothetical protein
VACCKLRAASHQLPLTSKIPPTLLGPHHHAGTAQTYTAKDDSLSCQFKVTVKPCLVNGAGCRGSDPLRIATKRRLCTARLPTVKTVVDGGAGSKVTWSSSTTAPVGLQTVKATVRSKSGETNTVSCLVEVYDNQPPVIKSSVKGGALCAYPSSPLSVRACWAPADLFTLTDNCLLSSVIYTYTCAVTAGGVDSDCSTETAAGGGVVSQVRLWFAVAGGWWGCCRPASRWWLVTKPQP